MAWLNVEDGSITNQKQNFIQAKDQYDQKLAQVETLIAGLKGSSIVGPVAEELENLFQDKKPIFQKVSQTFQEFIDNLDKADSETEATLSSLKLR